MECRKLELTLVSAQNLPNVRHHGRMKVYAKVSIKGESQTTKKGPVDYGGESNPRWNFVADYTISESTVQQPGVNLVVKLLCRRTLGDRFIGKVKIPVKSLFDMGEKSRKILSYDVTGTPEGRLNLLYSFSERMLLRQPSSSGWKTALGTVGFLVLVGGAMLLLNAESDRDEDDSKGACVEDDEDEDKDEDEDEDEVFYDAC